MLPQRWIVGTDLSPGSDAALRLAVAWSRLHGGAIDVVHAVSELPAGPDLALLEEALRDQVQRAGGDELADPVIVEVRAGDARDVLTRGAGSRAGIVVGAEGSSAMLLRQAGRVPAALALEAAVPVLIAPLGWHGPGRRRRRAPAGSGAPRRRRDVGAPFSRLMAACSLSARDGERIELMAALARSGERLMLAHSVDLSAQRHHPPSLRGGVRARSLAQSREAEGRLRDLSTERVPVDITAGGDVLVHVVRQGPPERDLAGLADSQSVELLLAGTGPVTARLVGVTTTPLLVMP